VHNPFIPSFWKKEAFLSTQRRKDAEIRRDFVVPLLSPPWFYAGFARLIRNLG